MSFLQFDVVTNLACDTEWIPIKKAHRSQISTKGEKADYLGWHFQRFFTSNFVYTVKC